MSVVPSRLEVAPELSSFCSYHLRVVLRRDGCAHETVLVYGLG